MLRYTHSRADISQFSKMNYYPIFYKFDTRQLHEIRRQIFNLTPYLFYILKS